MADYWWAALGLVLIIEGLGPMFFRTDGVHTCEKLQINLQCRCNSWVVF